MSICVGNIIPPPFPFCPSNPEATKLSYLTVMHKLLIFKKSVNFAICESHTQHSVLAATVNSEQVEKIKVNADDDNKPKFKWLKIGSDITESQKQYISELSPKMSNRCTALLKNLICYSHQTQNVSLSDLLRSWVRVMKPRRTDWLSILKQLKLMEHPLYLEVAELALLEESFEADVRDYTKVIHCYGKLNRPKDAEKILLVMKERGFEIDQVVLTTMMDVYSKSGKLNQAEKIFEDLKLLGHPLDKRAYGSMIMAFIRAGMPDRGEALLREMDAEAIYAGSEVYKALLRAYSIIGDADGAQRVFDAIQFACIPPDARVCGLLVNAYLMAGLSKKAVAVFQNMRRAGVEPNDKCIALVLAAYEKENNLDEALNLLTSLENEGMMLGKEASQMLAGWFRRLGVVKEVELVLREVSFRTPAH
ncbi:pentatricopeptide repeat-containing protein At1g01970 [Mercurialis annua]|uniref:pentatricopeptide repeat-containing protein At1g01970 n=1 Tax=Mercurialis annua TaxID=3986 RepID=UPI00215F3FCA|nr:pentatricopeptide repeat-containing protein At1g01970 [Mercurialis annua]